MTDQAQNKSNIRVAAYVTCMIGGMVGVAYAAVPLYDLFCRVTGFGGTTQVADDSDTPAVILDRELTIRFDANTDPDLPWTFKPSQNEQKIRIGEPGLAFYTATNTSDEPVVGQATYNVHPSMAGGYFYKVHCFCFDEQVLLPGESIEMPVQYYVDPEYVDEWQLDGVHQLTLSYTFFRSVDEESAAEAIERRLAAERLDSPPAIVN